MQEKIVVMSSAELLAIIEQAISNSLQSGKLTDKKVDTILGANQASEYLGIPKQTLYKLTSNRKIPFSKVGRSNKFRRSELDSWLTENQKKTTKEIIKSLNS